MRKTNIILLGSTNKGKIKEFKELFKTFPQVELKTLNDFTWNPASFENVQEDGKTYYDNAFKKAYVAHNAAKLPTISDDTGIEIQALEGKPGIHSHRYAVAKAGQSQDEANNKKLLEELKGVPEAKRIARFVCTIVFLVEGIALKAEGVLEGKILDAPRGDKGFGYDSLFVPNGSQSTLAEMTMAEKNKISHRAKAIANLMNQIKEKKIELVRP